VGTLVALAFAARYPAYTAGLGLLSGCLQLSIPGSSLQIINGAGHWSTTLPPTRWPKLLHPSVEQSARTRPEHDPLLEFW
jgi:hypothetical protein